MNMKKSLEYDIKSYEDKLQKEVNVYNNLHRVEKEGNLHYKKEKLEKQEEELHNLSEFLWKWFDKMDFYEKKSIVGKILNEKYTDRLLLEYEFKNRNINPKKMVL